MKTTMKQFLKKLILDNAHAKRIHIIGCSRSGTTMLHYALCAFENTVLYDKECMPWDYPGLRESFASLRQFNTDYKAQFIITKRPKWWFQDHLHQGTIDYIRQFNAFLIHVVRDPRDVLTSRHSLAKDGYYVSPQMWQASIRGAEAIFAGLADYPNKLIVRYEDIVRQPQTIESVLENLTGMRKRLDVLSMDRLRDNMIRLGKDSGFMIPYMHELRNFDALSIGRWRSDSQKSSYIEHLLSESQLGAELRAFLEKYNYPLSEETIATSST